MARCGLALAVLALVTAAWSSSGATAKTSPELTVIGDSVLTAVEWNQEPLSILESGFDVNLQIGVCRTLTGRSCPFNGARVPTLLDLVRTLGSQLGPNVLVELGYNDPPDTFAQSVEQAISALLAAGVQRIFWVNMHEHVWHPQYVAMNRVVDEAAQRHPEVTLLDWRTHTRNSWAWFQSDGVHLTYAGAIAMATFLHGSVVEALSPLSVAEVDAPAATVGLPYDLTLTAAGGIPPYRWSESGIRLKGLRLLASGRLYGTPTRAGRVSLEIRATDAFGYTASRRLVLVVQPKP
jgi:Putative Ig domain